MSIFKNKTQKQIEAINQQLNTLNQQWYSMQTITNKATIDASNVAMSIGGENSINGFNSTTYNQIQKNMLPSYMSWDYWVMINQWVDYWLNRYTNFDHDKKEQILLCIRSAIMFGVAALDKKDFTPYYCSFGDYLDNKVLCYPAYMLFNSTAIGISNGNLYLSDKLRGVEKNRDDLYILQWRFNNIGDYVWCLKDILTDIYIKKIIECNLSQLTNKLMYKVKNVENFRVEAEINANPFSNYGVVIGDEQAANNFGNNNLIDYNKTATDSHIDALIMGHKHHVEYYYNKYGRVITSSKQQSLSSDANLSISSAELVADEHDRRVIEFCKLFGVHLAIKEIEPVMKPQNENADKAGEGYHNTDAHNINEKAKEE